MKCNLTKSMGSVIATAETESATALTNTTTRTIKTAVATKTQQQMTPPRNCKSLKTSGFTIIEVALVLAIAGLIFLVVFLALPALQNSQKDNARKQDVARVVSALQAYEADNGGDLSSLGTTTGVWYSSDGTGQSGFPAYYGKLSTKTGVGIYIGGLWNPGTTESNIYIHIGILCPNNARTPSPTSDAAVKTRLSNGSVYCVDM